MAVIQNENGIVAINTRDTGVLSNPFVSFFEGDGADVKKLYTTQPEVRTCVDFLSRNIGQLPIKAYNRVGDNERTRISEGPLAATLAMPAPGVTKTKWLQQLVSDIAVYGNSYHVKVRGESGQVALIRVPPEMVTVEGSWVRPDGYKIKGSSGEKTFTAEQIMHIAHGYNPDDQRIGLSPLVTLRHVLAEQAAAGAYREQYWKNAARMSGIIERPAGTPQWSDTARARFRAEWEAMYTGKAASGRTVVLEEGMTFKPVAFSARDSQLMESYQLTREMVATAFGIPIGLLGLGSFTYASLSEQHRQLYADCLAPWIVMLQEEMEAQLLPEFSVTRNTYIEIDVDAKLQGSIEERARIFQASVGGPYITRNEARAKLNLPNVEGGDELIVPLNVITGGMASPQDSAPPASILGAASAGETAPEVETKANQRAGRVQAYTRARREWSGKMGDAIEKSLRRQQASVTAKAGAKAAKGEKAAPASVYDRRRFAKEMAEDIKPVAKQAAKAFGNQIATRYGTEFYEEDMEDFIDAIATGAAGAVTKALSEQIEAALEEDDVTTALGDLFDSRVAGAALIGLSLATTIGNTARKDAAETAGTATKTWVVTNANPRPSHAAQNGQTVPFGEVFSNGMRWPGDAETDDAGERANCTCMLEFD
jgi:HK97 family phage portal protein